MKKELLTIKSGESIELEIGGKTIEIQAEEATPDISSNPSDHTIKALSSFFGKIEKIMPDLKGEKGDKGDKGDKGEDGKDGRDGINGKDGKDGTDGRDGKDGENGKSAYEISVENGFTGTIEEWVQSLKGKDGKNGRDGKDGAPGRPGDQGPRGYGVIGPAGPSAYQIAVNNGFVGTEQEWIDSLGISPEALQAIDDNAIAYSVAL